MRGTFELYTVVTLGCNCKIEIFGAKIFEGERMWGRGMGREVDMPFYAMQHLQAEIVETSLVFCFRRQEVLLFSFYLIYYQLY